jgi:ribonuclease HII
MARRRTTLSFERKLWKRGFERVAGVDEVGRGCLAGPVVAAAAIFPRDVFVKGVRDSKDLSPARREELLVSIQQRALAIGIGMCSPAEIDELNIHLATLRAMSRAVSCLEQPCDYLLIDGRFDLPGVPCPSQAVIGGDARCHCIAAASIVAKVTRDQLMVRMHEDYPEYGWAEHKGYPTASHVAAIRDFGPSPFHRMSFRIGPERKELSDTTSRNE